VRRINDRWVISSQDLIAELECSHRLSLEWSVINGLLPAPEEQKSEELELLAEQGIAHEKKIVERLRKSGSFLDIGEAAYTYEALTKAHNKTLAAIKDGIDTIYQATFFTGDFIGFADFLILNKDEQGKPVKDQQGRNVYDPVDAKSARSAKRAAVLQVAAYAAVMQELDLATPTKVQLWLGGDEKWSAACDDVIELAKLFMQRVREKINNYQDLPSPIWEAPRESCPRCRWQKSCVEGRLAANDLSLIQGIRSSTRNTLIKSGIKTLSQMAAAEDNARPKAPREVSKDTFENLKQQARIQLKGADSKKPIFEIKQQTALEQLPKANDGDIWFDMEGDPFANEGGGLEYMFGYLIKDIDKYSFSTFDATDSDSEQKAFVDFIDYVRSRREKYPQMHIYHYASYEVSALLRLAQRHGVYEFEVDSLVRAGVFIDLYTLVRRAFRFSTPSLSIKEIEKVYWDGTRDKELDNAVASVIQFEKALLHLQNGEEKLFKKIVDKIKSYNQDDVDSTRQLTDWVREQAELLGIEPKTQSNEVIMPTPDSLEVVIPIAINLLDGVPKNPKERNQTQQALALLSAAISFHQREERPAWWAIFDKASKDLDEMESFSDVVVPTKVECGMWLKEGNQRLHRRIVRIEASGVEMSHAIDYEHIPQLLYEYAPAGFKTISGSTRGFCEAKIIEIDGSVAIFEEQERKATGIWEGEPIAVLPGAPINTSQIQQVLREEIGGATLYRRDNSEELFPNFAWCDVLLRRVPRQVNGKLPKSTDPIKDITAALLQSNNSYIAVQGPPGTGKTYVGSHVIAKLIQQGWRVGVIAQSHTVIEHFMNNVRKIDSNIPMAKKGQSVKSRPAYHVDNIADWAAGVTTGYLIGGTVWSFSRAEVRLLDLDLMVIDEAGQFSLANSLVAISAAKRALLLGDPQQLPQVSQGNHPEPVNESVLSHILGGRKTIPDELGYFLEKSFRLHPVLAKAVSKLQYEGRLIADDSCSKRELSDVEAGIHVIDVEHLGNTVRSVEEAEVLLIKVKELIGKRWIGLKSDGSVENPRELTQKDILVVTGFNAQVRYLKSILRGAGYSEIKVGTVDKFQGQEAPIVFVSMVTSSSEDLPRGIEFLLSPNRLNVAISRAQWACFILCSPHLTVMEPSTPVGMVMLGKFVGLCR
jgi:uncharacterized protein